MRLIYDSRRGIRESNIKALFREQGVGKISWAQLLDSSVLNAVDHGLLSKRRQAASSYR